MRIVLATERTHFDAGAERLALEIAGRAQAELHVVLPLAGNPEFQIVAPERVATLESNARAALQDLADQARARDVSVSLHVREGEDLAREIVDEARERQADLLVTRRVGKRGMLARLVVGEMVNQVAAQAAMPVLMAPEAAAMWSRRVLAAIEPHADAESTARIAVALALLANAPLAVHADEGAAATVAQRARERGVACERTGAAPDAGFARRVAEADADLLVLGIAPKHAAHARIARPIEALIGSVAYPTVLVKPSS